MDLNDGSTTAETKTREIGQMPTVEEGPAVPEGDKVKPLLEGMVLVSQGEEWRADNSIEHLY